MTKKEKQKSEKPMTPEMMQMANAKLFDHINNQNFGSIEEINEFLRKNVNGKRIDEVVPLKKGKKSNIEKSDDLMYTAYESNQIKGYKIAQEALKLNPENIRALSYLASNTENIDEAFVLYKQAVEIGEKQLGETFFIENKGHFWGMHETRPYMTAKLSYAVCLFAMNKTDEAIQQYNEMLELNPNDNQGIRHILSTILLNCKKYNLYFELYKKFADEISTFGYFNYALFLFATEGATMKAAKALTKANKQNKYVLQFISGQKKIVTEPDGYYSIGDESEATIYLTENFKSWVECNGAVEWVLSYVENNKRLN